MPLSSRTDAPRRSWGDMRRTLVLVVVFAVSLFLSRAVFELTRPAPVESVPAIILRQAPPEPGGGAGPRPDGDPSGPGGGGSGGSGGGATPVSPPPPPRAGQDDDDDDDGDDTPDTADSPDTG